MLGRGIAYRAIYSTAEVPQGARCREGYRHPRSRLRPACHQLQHSGPDGGPITLEALVLASMEGHHPLQRAHGSR
jgi:hypothetical protein